VLFVDAEEKEMDRAKKHGICALGTNRARLRIKAILPASSVAFWIPGALATVDIFFFN
jgi:hypothetical protein